MRVITQEQEKAVAMLRLAFSNFTTAQAQVYQEVLADIPGALLQKAVLILLKTSKFPPTIAEIREKAEEIRDMALGKDAPNAERAWSDVIAAISRYGANRKPKFSDPICAAAVSCMGWMNLCMTPTDSISIIRAQFCKFYKVEAERRKKERQIHESISSCEMAQLLEAVGARLVIGKGEKTDG